jgi:hypothetical protein
MHNRIRQGFSQGKFDIIFAPGCAFHLPHQIHYINDDRVNRVAISCK